MIGNQAQTNASKRPQPSPSRKLNRLERAEVESILRSPIDYMDDGSFHEAGAEQTLFIDVPALPTPNTDWYHPAMERLQDTRAVQPVKNSLLTAKQERVIFLQFNYARFQATELHERLNNGPMHPAVARKLIHWYDRAEHLRDQIVQFNLALVLAMAKHVSSANLDYMELISEGNMALLRSIDKFDVSRGFKFSTYACRSILKAYSRMGVKQTKLRGLFPVTFDPEMEKPAENSEHVDHEEAELLDEMKQMLDSNAADLSDVEQQVIECRFQLGDHAADERVMTLTEVGGLIGYTKERVRQIQNRALGKLRAKMEERLGEEVFAND